MPDPTWTPDPPPRVALRDARPSDGAADGARPLVLVHGWTGSKEDFDPVLEVLSAERRVVAPDLPGHGGTPTPAGATAADHDVATTARWVVALLDALDLGEVHLLGHSLGGLVAQRVAYLASERLASLTLVGSGIGAVGEATADRILRVALTARDEGMDAAWAVVVDGADGGGGDPREAFVRRRFLAMDPEVVLGGARALTTAAPLGAFLRGIDLPVLVCHGEGDEAWLPHEQRLAARTIAGAVYRVVPDAMHSPAVENPRGLLDVLVPFLRRADDPARRPARR